VGRPKEHDDTIRLALLDAAETLITEGGAAALSVRTVAESVNTSTRAVYSLFGSKAGLLEALAVRLFELLSAAVDRVERTQDPIADVVTASLEGFRRVALTHTSLYNLVFLRVVPDLELGAEFAAIATKTFAQLEVLVSRITYSPMVHDETSRDDTTFATTFAAQTIHALTEGLVGMELRGALGSPEHAERIWRDAITTLCRGITNVA
jgi:AcrR family transcriptional regulator